MTFKNWINGLSLAQLMAYACQHGMNGWRRGTKRQLCSFLMNSKSGKTQFNEFYGT